MLIILCFGFISGLPLTLTKSTLVAMLTEHGFSKIIIGYAAAFALPYSLKFIWAPLVDNFKIPFLYNKLGRRRSWLVAAQIFLFISIIGISYNVQISNIYYFILFGFALAFFSATQDIVIDAYRVELLKDKEQGTGAAFSIFGYRVGMLVSGAGSLYIASFYDWQIAYFVMASFILASLAVTLVAPKPNIHLEPEKHHDIFTLAWLRINIVEPFANFIKNKKWAAVLLFIILYKAGDAFLGLLSYNFFLSIGFSKIEIANIVKIFGFLASIIGSFVGGYIVYRFSLFKSLLFCGILQALSNGVFIIQYFVGHKDLMLATTIAVENITGGMGAAVFVAYLSSLCNRKYTATQYALVSSFASLSNVLLTSFSGISATYMGWVGFFSLSIFIALPALALLFYIKDTILVIRKT